MDERAVPAAVQGRYIGEITHAELDRALDFEMPVDPVQRARGGRIDERGHTSLVVARFSRRDATTMGLPIQHPGCGIARGVAARLFNRASED
jgi:hypothetical protein